MPPRCSSIKRSATDSRTVRRNKNRTVAVGPAKPLVDPVSEASKPSQSYRPSAARDKFGDHDEISSHQHHSPFPYLVAQLFIRRQTIKIIIPAFQVEL